MPIELAKETRRAKLAMFLHHLVANVTERGEVLGNMMLVSATGWHEWPNEVAMACIPVMVFLVLHLIYTLIGEAD